MSDEEEDYMSEKFLSGLADVRPSLIKDRVNKRKIHVESKKAEVIKKQRDAQRERTGANRITQLQESLSRPIEAENKGFKMLSKMGYKPGQSLGKTNEVGNKTNQGLIEPIPINIKSDRGGLGRDAALRELAEKRARLRQERLLREASGRSEILSTEEFRSRSIKKAEERKNLRDLLFCQRTCESLDQQANIAAPDMTFFWPDRTLPDEESDEREVETEVESEAEVEQDYSTEEKIDMLTGYLRTTYIFCFWCGTRYDNVEDLSLNCPGTTFDDH